MRERVREERVRESVCERVRQRQRVRETERGKSRIKWHKLKEGKERERHSKSMIDRNR